MSPGQRSLSSRAVRGSTISFGSPTWPPPMKTSFPTSATVRPSLSLTRPLLSSVSSSRLAGHTGIQLGPLSGFTRRQPLSSTRSLPVVPTVGPAPGPGRCWGKNTPDSRELTLKVGSFAPDRPGFCSSGFTPQATSDTTSSASPMLSFLSRFCSTSARTLFSCPNSAQSLSRWKDRKRPDRKTKQAPHGIDVCEYRCKEAPLL
jgi:hypothetical protein